MLSAKTVAQNPSGRVSPALSPAHFDALLRFAAAVVSVVAFLSLLVHAASTATPSSGTVIVLRIVRIRSLDILVVPVGRTHARRHWRERGGRMMRAGARAAGASGLASTRIARDTHMFWPRWLFLRAL